MTVLLRKRPKTEGKDADRVIKKIEENNASLAYTTSRAQKMEMATIRTGFSESYPRKGVSGYVHVPKES